MNVSHGELVANMPLLPPGTCNANQTYIPPGGVMTGARYPGGLVTPTGACIDNPPASVSNTDGAGMTNISSLAVIGFLVLGLFLLGRS